MRRLGGEGLLKRSVGLVKLEWTTCCRGLSSHLEERPMIQPETHGGGKGPEGLGGRKVKTNVERKSEEKENNKLRVGNHPL